MDLDELKLVLVPPRRPVETGDEQAWEQVERALGTALPADYKAFIATYGTGMIDEFIWVFSPFAHDPSANLPTSAERGRKAYLDMRAQFPQHWSLSLFPEPGGLLPWGSDHNGDLYFWRTEGEPDAWPTVVYYIRSEEHYEYNQPMTVFLRGLLTRTLDCPLIDPTDLWDPPQFQTDDDLNR